MKQNRPYRFIISGGGTGGHIYPALAVANEIRTRYAHADILFVGATGRMEMTKVPEAGYPIEGLWISGIQRKLTMDNLLFPVKVILSYFKAARILKKFKPTAVLGFGGYASGPIMMAATSKGTPALIQEQNSYAGLTNKRVAKGAMKVCVAYEGMDKYFPADKVVLTGNPVRADIVNTIDKREEGLQHFGLNPDKKTILVLGGSLGARTINNSVVGDLDKILAAGVQLIWQTGRFYYDEMLKRVEGKELNGIHITQFINEMDLAYAAANVVISRAGALSISELCIVGKPVIFVPSPNVAEDHQTKNARALTEKDAAVMITDGKAHEHLIPTTLKLLGNEEECEKLSKNIKGLAKPNATQHIVDELIKMIN